MLITSRTNARIKLARQLHRRKGRAREGRWLVEGVRPLEEVLRHRVQPETVFVTAEARRSERVERLLQAFAAGGADICEVSDALMREVSDAQTPQGVVGIVPAPSLQEDVFQAAEPWLLAVDRVQDPGNLGTMCRTALAAAVTGVVLLEGTVDPGNPKVIRASAGALFGLRLCVLPADAFVAAVRQHGVRLLTADLGAAQSIYEADWTGRVALLVGNEASGPDAALLRASDGLVRIPMPGPVESLNVSIATALCLFEGVRQRLLRRADG